MTTRMTCVSVAVAICSALCGCEPVQLAGERQGIHRGRRPNPYPESSSTAVFLVDTGFGFEPACSGTLVGRRAVVSAAHCFSDGGLSGLRVAFGPDGARGRAMVRLGSLQDIDALFTDRRPPASIVAKLGEMGVVLHMVDELAGDSVEALPPAAMPPVAARR